MPLMPDAPELPDISPRKSYKARVADINDVHDRIRILKIQLENGAHMTFKAGQYADLTFDERPPRPYSIASTPDQGNLLEFHILNTGKNGASAYACSALKLGETVTVSGPQGENYLRTDTEPVLAIAGGVGIVPIKSILETALKKNMKQPIHLYWGTRTEDELYLGMHFITLSRKYPQFHFVPVFSEAAPEKTSCRTGLVGNEALKDFEDLSGFHAYLAGPAAMVLDTAPRLLDKGVARDHIHSDAFP